MGSVSDAIAVCAGGFTLTAKGAEQKIVKIASEKGSATGDESAAISASVVMEDKGAPGTVHAEGRGTAAHRRPTARSAWARW
ncbi:hypothetical protein [Streptomyces sp. NPDC047706]|uniref:hypothetical protein n=1 Tax=Streptomyces sp. NPDC047706 TaxID=3365486 RepID=UPI003711F2AF